MTERSRLDFLALSMLKSKILSRLSTLETIHACIWDLDVFLSLSQYFFAGTNVLLAAAVVSYNANYVSKI